MITLSGSTSMTALYVYYQYNHVHKIPLVQSQVIPVSTVTVTQQDPFMLFYKLNEGMYCERSNTLTMCNTTTLGETIYSPIKLCDIQCLSTAAYLTDEVLYSTANDYC